MRFAIISDIHGNLEALEAVLAHIKKRSIKEIICLGDVVGYGPNPMECLEIVMGCSEVCLKGNHDEAITEGVCLFHAKAKQAIEWTQKLIVESGNKEKFWPYLEQMPLIYSMEKYVFLHASPLEPTSDYILMQNLEIEEEKFHKIFKTFDSILFVGHTHVPCVIEESLEAFTLDDLGFKYLVQETKAIVNVGSVGQPRDNDPRATYLEVIDNMFFFHRVPYDIEKTKTKIFENENLDNYLGERLLLGK